MPRKASPSAQSAKKDELSNIRIGEDGFPIPDDTKRVQNKFLCICPICQGANAHVKLAKSVNYVVRCPSCSIMLYLNDNLSVNLFRGMQAYFNAHPEKQVEHTRNIVAFAPDVGQ